MSVFSKIKRSRQQAKEHSKKEADKAKKEAEHPPYRHVPTHAAIDALNGAPAAWREDDREKIVENNRIRHAMAASGRGSKTPASPGTPVWDGLPRVGSSLSQVSYPPEHAIMPGPPPRTYSYHGELPGARPYRGSSGSMYAAMGDGHWKGKETDASRASPMLGANSAVGSSGDSSSSQDDLEIRPAVQRHSTMPITSSSTSPLHQAVTSRASIHRLHPSSRRNSDASDRGSITGHTRTPSAAGPSSPASRGPPPSMLTRGYGAMPAAMPSVQAQLPGQLPLNATTGTVRETATPSPTRETHKATEGSYFAPFDFGINDTAGPSSPTSVPRTFAQSNDSSLTPSMSMAQPQEPASDNYHTRPAKPSAPEARTSRLIEMENAGNAPSGHFDFSMPPPEVSNDAINQALGRDALQKAPQPSLPEMQPGAGKAKRLNKQPPATKLSKKSRWSSKGAGTVVV